MPGKGNHGNTESRKHGKPRRKSLRLRCTSLREGVGPLTSDFGLLPEPGKPNTENTCIDADVGLPDIPIRHVAEPVLECKR